jgi:DNA-binding NtrC family response regulator
VTRTILIADDDPHILESISEILEMHDYKVVTAINSKDALEMLTNALPDLCIVDLTMPGFNGTTLAVELGKPDAIDIPVIFVSGMSRGDADERIARKKENRYFLSKPFDIEQLISLIERALKSAGTGNPGGNGGSHG